MYISGDNGEDDTLSFEQRNAQRLDAQRASKKKKAVREQEAQDHRLRKEPRPSNLTGLVSALQEWARALLGLPRVSPSPSASTSQPSIKAILDHHLPAEPTEREVDVWTNYASRRKEFLDSAVDRKMAQLLANNPTATSRAKQALRKRVTKEAVQSFAQANPPKKFVSRVVHATASTLSYNSTCLSLAEGTFSLSGFPRLTFQWLSPLSTYWNMAMLDNMVTTWLDCHNSRGTPSSYTIAPELDLAKEAHEILSQWVSNKRRVYRIEAKEKNLLATTEGTQQVLAKVRSNKQKAAMRRLKNKVRTWLPFFHHPSL